MFIGCAAMIGLVFFAVSFVVGFLFDAGTIGDRLGFSAMFGGIAFLASVLLWWRDRRQFTAAKQRAQKRLLDLDDLDDDRFLQEMPEHEAELCLQVRQAIAEFFAVPAAKIHPTVQFREELECEVVGLSFNSFVVYRAMQLRGVSPQHCVVFQHASTESLSEFIGKVARWMDAACQPNSEAADASKRTAQEVASENAQPTFLGGNPNPRKLGFISLRSARGEGPDPAQLEHAVEILNRTALFVDAQGYECDMFAAAVHPRTQRVVYLESRAKEQGKWVDIAIKIHLYDPLHGDKSVDIESYNPFFGCDVLLLEWIDDSVALLVYREKHWTFVYRIGDRWPPPFVKIEDRWQIKDGVLSYVAYKAETVQRLSVPSLQPLPVLTLSEAEHSGQLPPPLYE
jgi:hypothetical protein